MGVVLRFLEAADKGTHFVVKQSSFCAAVVVFGGPGKSSLSVVPGAKYQNWTCFSISQNFHGKKDAHLHPLSSPHHSCSCNLCLNGNKYQIQKENGCCYLEKPTPSPGSLRLIVMSENKQKGVEHLYYY